MNNRRIGRGMYRRVMYEFLGKDAFVLEELRVSENLWDEIANRVSWYRDRYEADIEVMNVSPGTGSFEARIQDHYGAPLCWHCLGLAVARCGVCGCYCCGKDAWSMRAEVREMLSIPAGQLAVECSDCVCK